MFIDNLHPKANQGISTLVHKLYKNLPSGTFCRRELRKCHSGIIFGAATRKKALSMPSCLHVVAVSAATRLWSSSWTMGRVSCLSFKPMFSLHFVFAFGKMT
ncbi:Uncharacterized protein TCM_037949 [Theobroma cacao]|uniref:Uncharacterized protein n=1 Tax=Theobroma cacao TaxID=3641 RepID=A0A061GMY7_THECC|nr:Uncharacterized protein TCM_037949 [Theobroma cacao]